MGTTETTFYGVRDVRPQRGFWAPGRYRNTCSLCDEEFIGDKRAKVCADCAYGSVGSSWMVRAALAVSDWVKEVYASYLLRKIEREARRRKRIEEASQDPSDAVVTVVDFRRVGDTSEGGSGQEQPVSSSSSQLGADREGE